jgi:adenosylmethionine-8-amino-7-oxononanoate aminotransferase
MTTAVVPRELLIEEDDISNTHKSYNRSPSSYLLNRNVNVEPLSVSGMDGKWIYLADGRRVLDASGGAAVMCIGAKARSVKAAWNRQFDTGIMYVPSSDFNTEAGTTLACYLVESTNGDLTQVVFYNSGMCLTCR